MKSRRFEHDIAPQWRTRAACFGMDPELWYPEGRAATQQATAAIGICNGCPVWRDCLADALQAEGAAGRDARHGIRGATTPLDRWHMHRSQMRHAFKTAQTATQPSELRSA